MLEALVEAVPQGIQLLTLEQPDDPGSFRWFASNRAACVATDRNLGSFVNRSWRDVAPELVESRYPELLRRVLDSGDSLEWRTAPGDPWLPRGHWHGSAHRLEGRTVAVVVDELKDVAAAESDDQLRLQLRRAEAQRDANRRQLERFAYAASHDLSEPLRVVSSYVSLFKKKFGAALDERAMKYLHYIVQGTDQMQAQVDGLLRWSRVHSQGGERTRTPSGEAWGAAKARLSSKIAERRAEILEPSSMPEVLVDPVQLTELFQHLLDNSLKFAKPGETPKVRLTAETSHEEACFCLCDGGLGIQETQRERVFDLFSQLHPEAHPGQGLGLALSREIVARAGGRIWIEAEPNGGSRFCFSLIRGRE